MGEVFAGRYELIEPIAEGGMGTVWLVVDRTAEDYMAAKILRQSDAASLLRFVREQSMRIDHSHVVTPQSWAGMDDRVLFTMPLVRGGSLAGMLSQRGALSLTWIAEVLDQTLQALSAVHAAGIVHRDVKPANLLLEPTGTGRPHVRLTDFGIAVPLDQPRMTQAHMAVGSPGYMAPEQWNAADPHPRQDVYAVGRVGIEMLTGVRPPTDPPPDPVPPTGGDPSRTAEKVATPPWRRIPDDALPAPVPAARALLEVLGRAADPDPTRRQQDAEQLRDELRTLGLDRLPPDPPVEVSDQFGPGALGAVDDHATMAPATRINTPPGGAGGADPRPRRPATPAAAPTPAVALTSASAAPLPAIGLWAAGGVLLVLAALVWFA